MKDKIVFVHIPKTAGKSIWKSLHKAGRIYELWGGKGIHPLAKDMTYHVLDGKPVLGCIRNPYDRLYSIYYYFVKLKPHRRDINYDNTDTFEDFILHYEKQFYQKRPYAWQISDFVKGPDGNSVLTDIIRFENLEEDYINFCKKYDVKNYINEYRGDNFNKIKDRETSKDEIYTEEMREVVERLYSEDLKLYDYSYESWLEGGKL